MATLENTTTEQSTDETTARPWHFETHLYKNSADPEYRIMGTNEDAGKSGVCYSGRFLAIGTTESRDDALLIVRAVNTYASRSALLSQILADCDDAAQTSDLQTFYERMQANADDIRAALNAEVN